jgi:RHS repeat-associated protein
MSGGKISSPIFGQSWNPDALGNFESVTNTTYGSSTITENRTHNRQNQLGTLTITGSSTTTLSYDSAGSLSTNVTDDGKSKSTTTFTFDAWNRTINFKGTGRYAYDPLNRRIKEDTKALVYSNNWQVLEERTSGTVSFRYAWSPVYVDAMIARDEYTYDPGTSKYVVGERLYAATDANYNVTALINTSGGVDERFGYDPYGAVKLLDNTWGSVTTSANGWVYLHQDGRLDEATGMYHFRNRDTDADLMRWNRVDPIGFCSHDSDLYRLLNCNPLNFLDPFGNKAVALIDFPRAPALPPPGFPRWPYVCVVVRKVPGWTLINTCSGDCVCDGPVSVPLFPLFLDILPKILDSCCHLTCNKGHGPNQPAAMQACVQSLLRAGFGSQMQCKCS